MKTRIIHTKVWKDNWFANLSKDAKLLWHYLLSNEKINISGIYELSDREIVFDTSIDTSMLDLLKKELEPKAMFYKGWVKVSNVERYNKYRNSPLNETAYWKELSAVPSDIRAYFQLPDDTSIYTSIDTLRNNKSKIINQKEEINDNDEPAKKPQSMEEFRKNFGVAKTGITKQWQDEAFRHAEYLNIDLKKSESLKGRWLRFYKQASTQPELSGRIQQALSFLKDYDPFLRIADAEGRMLYFFDVVQNYEKYHEERR